MKIVTIVGARPQFIKAAALSRAIAHADDEIQEVIVHTGQHYDHNMSDVFFEEMCIPHPQYHLGIGGCPQGAMTGRMLESIEEVLVKEQPDWTLIYGDTNSTLAGALAAVKLHIPVAHVEAGLRSFNRKMPEEINRIVADQCADLLFTPSQIATDQLKKENICHQKICQAGDIMYDAALHYRQLAEQKSSILNTLQLNSKKYVLATVHRQENTDNAERLTEIISGLAGIGRHETVVLPLHPRTKQAADKFGLLKTFGPPQLLVIEPLGYLDMIRLESNASTIITDSGGIQKEAYFFHIPCLTVREETEWVELVQRGYNMLVPADRNEIVRSYEKIKSTAIHFAAGLYGRGNTSELIVKELLGRRRV